MMMMSDDDDDDDDDDVFLTISLCRIVSNTASYSQTVPLPYRTTGSTGITVAVAKPLNILDKPGNCMVTDHAHFSGPER